MKGHHDDNGAPRRWMIDMAQLWHAERGMDVAQAKRLIEAQFPALAPASVSVLGEGWDNHVFAVNGRWAFRFPRREVAVPFIATEARLLPPLAQHLPLPIPVPHFHGQPAEDYPWPFLGYTLLPGTIAARARLDAAARVALAVPLANFLRVLHAVPLELAHASNVPADEIARLDSARRAQLTSERLDALVARGVIRMRAPIDDALAAAPAYAPTATQLIHGDLHAGQLLVDAQGAACGVIDWGDVHIGDPGTDLAAAHALLPASAHGAFLAAYGHVPAGRWAAARARATWHGVALAAYGTDIGDAALVQEALDSLGMILGETGWRAR